MNIMKFPAFFQMCQLQTSTIFLVRRQCAHAHTRDTNNNNDNDATTKRHTHTHCESGKTRFREWIKHSQSSIHTQQQTEKKNFYNTHLLDLNY